MLIPILLRDIKQGLHHSEPQFALCEIRELWHYGVGGQRVATL